MLLRSIVMAGALACAVPAVAQSASEPDQRWARLTPEMFADLGTISQLQIMYLKFDRSRLDDEQCASFWIDINDPRTREHRSNEFRWRAIRDYYKTHAGEILDALPARIKLDMQVLLGSYDFSAKGFPLFTYMRQELVYGAGIGFQLHKAACGKSKFSPFGVEFDQVWGPVSLPMHEDAARELVARLGASRSAVLELVATLSDPKVKPFPAQFGSLDRNTVVFRAHIEAARLITRKGLDDKIIMGDLIASSDAAINKELDFKKGGMSALGDLLPQILSPAALERSTEQKEISPP